jgi:hypothetical protein
MGVAFDISFARLFARSNSSRLTMYLLPRSAQNHHILLYALFDARNLR